MPTAVERLAALFRGNDRVHGQYVVAASPGERGKVDGLRKETVHAPLTVELWKRHLTGNNGFGLGVAPLRDDGSCWFGAIDIDDYGIDLPALDRLVARLGLPLTVCRTKSGGAHLYVFFSEPIPAEVLRIHLASWASALGYPGIEIFPKQDRLDATTSDGNWINAPYQANLRTVRYALRNGAAIDLEEFLDDAETRRVTTSDLESLTLPEAIDDELFLDGPPCLQTLSGLGFPSGMRNNGLFDIAVYLRKRYEDGWQSQLNEYNQRFMDPPLSELESSTIARSVSKKTYSYLCKAAPIAQHCDRKECLRRRFGIGNTAVDHGVTFGKLIQLDIDPPLWVWEVNGSATLIMDTQTMYNQGAVAMLLTDKLRIVPHPVKPGAWLDLVRRFVTDCTVEQVPEDATADGQWWGKLEEFCTSRAKGKSLDELLLDKPFTNPETKRTYFRIASILAYLTQARIPNVSERRLYVLLRDRGARSHVDTVKGKKIQFWSVPAFDRQQEDHEVPRTDLGKPM